MICGIGPLGFKGNERPVICSAESTVWIFLDQILKEILNPYYTAIAFLCLSARVWIPVMLAGLL